MGAPLITATEVARLLGVSRRFVYDLASSRRLASYRIGGAVRFAPDDVEAFMQASRVEVRSPMPQPAARQGVNLSHLLRDPDNELMRYFERRGVKVREAPASAKKGNK